MPAPVSRAMPDTDPIFGAPHYTASPTLSFCILGGTVIVLDIAADRYFALGAARGAQIIAGLAGKEEMARPHVSGPALTGDRLAGALYVDRQRPVPATLDFPRADPSRLVAGMSERWRAVWLQIAAIVRLKILGFERTLHWATRSTARARERGFSRDAMIAAHRWARSALPFKDACLPASLALARGLSRAGGHYELIVGVKINPFAAHCWLEAESAVLNDDLETIRQFTPIRIVRG